MGRNRIGMKELAYHIINRGNSRQNILLIRQTDGISKSTKACCGGALS